MGQRVSEADKKRRTRSVRSGVSSALGLSGAGAEDDVFGCEIGH